MREQLSGAKFDQTITDMRNELLDLIDKMHKHKAEGCVDYYCPGHEVASFISKVKGNGYLLAAMYILFAAREEQSIRKLLEELENQ